jgi:hypothetical protein
MSSTSIWTLVAGLIESSRQGQAGPYELLDGGPPNKGMKQTKPSVLELRSLSPVFDGRLARLTG